MAKKRIYITESRLYGIIEEALIRRIVDRVLEEAYEPLITDLDEINQALIGKTATLLVNKNKGVGTWEFDGRETIERIKYRPARTMGDNPREKKVEDEHYDINFMCSLTPRQLTTLIERGRVYFDYVDCWEDCMTDSDSDYFLNWRYILEVR